MVVDHVNRIVGAPLTGALAAVSGARIAPVISTVFPQARSAAICRERIGFRRVGRNGNADFPARSEASPRAGPGRLRGRLGRSDSAIYRLITLLLLRIVELFNPAADWAA